MGAYSCTPEKALTAGDAVALFKLYVVYNAVFPNVGLSVCLTKHLWATLALPSCPALPCLAPAAFPSPPAPNRNASAPFYPHPLFCPALPLQPPPLPSPQPLTAQPLACSATSSHTWAEDPHLLSQQQISGFKVIEMRPICEAVCAPGNGG